VRKHACARARVCVCVCVRRVPVRTCVRMCAHVCVHPPPPSSFFLAPSLSLSLSLFLSLFLSSLTLSFFFFCSSSSSSSSSPLISLPLLSSPLLFTSLQWPPVQRLSMCMCACALGCRAAAPLHLCPCTHAFPWGRFLGVFFPTGIPRARVLHGPPSDLTNMSASASRIASPTHTTNAGGHRSDVHHHPRHLCSRTRAERA